jgi:sortase A
MSVALNRLLRGMGWLFISIGVLVLLYLVYSLLYTNRATEQAQDDLADEWNLSLPDGAGELPGEGDDGESAPPDPGSAVAALEFRRPGQDEPIVHKEPLYVVHGVSLGDLQRGPGHYPGTAMPGEKGNFAVAGHRTTYGAPFFNLDQLRKGDEVIVTARDGERYTYRVQTQDIVAPSDTWVIAADPLERGRNTLTLTTCNPRFSNAERLVVFAELVT